MPNIKKMHSAKAQKYDEFFTPMNAIENEIYHYSKHLKGKTILCNCDDPERSNFWKHFKLKFKVYGLKKLISTHFIPKTDPSKNERSYKLEFDGSEVIKTPLTQNGDFRNEECVELLKETDIVITNPPFSLFREYISQLMEHNKKFIVIGNMNAVTYKEIIPYILNNKIWMGVSPHRIWFNVPEKFEITTKNVRYDENKKPLVQVGGACWFTNLNHSIRTQEHICHKKYDPDMYPEYDNYKAIEVKNIKLIPKDFPGKMGVPITFIFKHNPDQFKIVGANNTVPKTKIIDNKTDRFFINEKPIYTRLVIQWI